MSKETEIKTLLTIHYHRWQKLRRYVPLPGYKIDLAALTEIEDIEAEMKRLRENLRQYQAKPPRAKLRATRPEATGEGKALFAGAGPSIDDPENYLAAIAPATSSALAATRAAQVVLKVMFPNYERVNIKERLDDGLGESYTFLVRPYRPGNIMELSAVVKIAPTGLIRQEAQAYHRYIRDCWPNTVPMRAEPIFYDDWGGLCYPLRGKVRVAGLYDYAYMAHLIDVRFIFKERLLRLLKHVIQFDQQMVTNFSFQASYDHVMPVNLCIELQPEPFETQPPTLTPVHLLEGDFCAGAPVRLERFMVARVKPLQRMMAVTLPPAGDGSPRSYWVHLQVPEEMLAYQVGHVIDAVEGWVIRTRSDYLFTVAKQILAEAVDITGIALIMPDGTQLPNPLFRWPVYLNQIRPVKVGTVNGGMTGGNVLVDKDIREVYFTNFVEARQDHLLHNFLQLETEILTQWLPDIFARSNLEATLIVPFYEQLHRAVTHFEFPEALPHPDLDKPFEMLTIIRQAARNYFIDHQDWSEYYEGLVLYLLGALKRPDSAKSGHLPKQVAFWGAALTCRLIDKP